MHIPHRPARRRAFSVALALLFCFAAAAAAATAQDTVTGAFEGTVSDSRTRQRISGALVEITNQTSGINIRRRSDAQGRFYQGLLPPGVYLIRVSAPGYRPDEKEQLLFTTRPNQVIPLPFSLDPEPAPAAAAQATATPTPPPPPLAPTPAAPGAAGAGDEAREVAAEINRTNARRGGAFSEREVSSLPLGAATFVRTFDELALLLPGVAPPPQTFGRVAGPGVGAGVGSAGQFAVNGLRSRANNFTVDGSDNNDEDIGVRRQGFTALIPQPIESVKEFQAITLLAPAQFGRNLGAQVNAVSKSGGNETHGTVYGFFNASQLNARNFFDSAGGSGVTTLRENNQDVLLRVRDRNRALVSSQPITVVGESGGEDSLTFYQGGFAFGGPLLPGQMFYFVSGEGQKINATQEESFAVPTVSQRSAFGTGATGIFRNPFTGTPVSANPSTTNGAAVFSLFPFPNNPGGVYGANTFTQVLPAAAEGRVLSGKLDEEFKLGGRQQSAAARYNFTDDFRDIPATGGAVFSALRARVRTQNFSFFFNSQLSAPDSARPVFNQVRLSYGRTRLQFQENRDRQFLLPSERFPNTPFLLNAPSLRNLTLPTAAGVANTGGVVFDRFLSPAIDTTEDEIGAVGQVSIAGFSPVGVDVFNFPQRRVNNTYQFADTLTVRSGDHGFTFGTDNRRTELNSDLPRNSRPLVTFNGGPRLVFENNAFRLPRAGDPLPVVRPEDLAAFGAASNFFLTLNTAGTDSTINLRFYQLNFFGQDEWRVRPDLSLSAGLRYEYNTPAREVNRRIEDTFDDAALDFVPGLRQFIEGRTRIFDPDRNNFAPRVGFAYSPDLFGPGRPTVIRAGYGLFHDQILGAVVSQSRNVFPTFLTLNFGGLLAEGEENFLTTVNPAATAIGANQVPLLLPGSLNRANPALPLRELVTFFAQNFPDALGATLPSRRLDMPLAHHFTVQVEQQLGESLAVSAAYVGTAGRNLLRFTTPNLGPASTIAPTRFNDDVFFNGTGFPPEFFGRVLPPPRPVGGVGAINRFETTASSRYDSLQLQMRGRLRRSLQYQVAYTLSKATDDVSDVFDLAGAFTLPQNSLTLAGERGPANFDVRQRLAYNFVYDFPHAGDRRGFASSLLDGLQIAGTGRFRTGQPFTVNSIFDVNLDGNLTDRLNSTSGIVVTGDRRQPLRLATTDTLGLLAPFGQDGSVGRNTFRAGNVLELDLSVSKNFVLANRQRLIFRADIFNFINRANFGVPLRLLEAPGFGQATSTVTPGRRVQFALKYAF